MTEVLKNCKPESVFRYFEEISNIPRASGQEAKISEFLVKFAKDRSLEVIQDEALNVIIKKGGTQGYENAPIIVLQGHMDMVCEKNNDTVHNFETDPLKLKVNGDYIYAEGTTLGADNGIALAYGLALLDATDIPHPPLELLITTDEEVGLLGAAKVDPAHIKGRILINMDSEEEGKLLVSCAGGVRAHIHIPVQWEAPPQDIVSYTLAIKGLKGGHSGSDIHKQRGNANKLLARILYDLFHSMDLFVQEVTGGAKDNAIPREADVLFGISSDKIQLLQQKANQWSDVISRELKKSDEGVVVELKPSDRKLEKIMSKDTLEKFMNALIVLPNGVQTMSVEIEGLVQSSTNLGVVVTKDQEIEMVSALRSSIQSLRDHMMAQMDCIAKGASGTVTTQGDYPAWEYNPDSYIRSLFEKVHENVFGKKVEIEAIHAGLECGLFAQKFSQIDMISFGPDMWDVHTPDEKLSISSTARTWDYLLAVLKEVK